MNSNRQENRKTESANEIKKWDNNKDFSSMKISFKVTKKNSSYYRAGNYGKKRIHFFSNHKENDKNHYELYHFHIQPSTTHSNKLTCFIKENERIIYSGKNFQ
ncbi:hypothetical protein AS034_16575 [[Bacillus] enclensis]|uniref:Uncharacterized protein n=1 Tax=[Bacillus] enclensis TaxID=1402860 RepID=A0A0V8HDC8_9BACI|nr:hypothetical protein [[Bacillus] enclensis]KSU60455.1 hypothetical protein AS034_16575 [[Bacillus] enclensis]SCC24704.1 hypothetical protein GA0061094_3428 [[Bacillus] enclensis]